MNGLVLGPEWMWRSEHSGAKGSRTLNLPGANRTLSQLSYSPLLPSFYLRVLRRATTLPITWITGTIIIAAFFFLWNLRFGQSTMVLEGWCTQCCDYWWSRRDLNPRWFLGRRFYRPMFLPGNLCSMTLLYLILFGMSTSFFYRVGFEPTKSRQTIPFQDIDPRHATGRLLPLASWIPIKLTRKLIEFNPA